MRRGLLGLGVGLALADSSIVTLALPEILGQFDVSITTVAWVLTSFNLVLAIFAVPAAYVARRRPREAFGVGVARRSPRRRSPAGSRRRSTCSSGRAACRRWVRRCSSVRARPSLAGRERRARAPRLGHGRCARRGARAGGGRNPHAGARLGVDLLRAGTAGPRALARAPRPRRSSAASARRSPVASANAALLLLSGGLVAALFLSSSCSSTAGACPPPPRGSRSR